MIKKTGCRIEINRRMHSEEESTLRPTPRQLGRSMLRPYEWISSMSGELKAGGR